MSYVEELKAAVKTAIIETMNEVLANHPNESLNGYGLVTDDNLRTLGFAASSQELSDAQEEYARFEPVEWTYDDKVEAFDPPGELMAKAADSAASVLSHVNESFTALVESLQELKAAGHFSDEVFLTVISADPSEYLERLEAGAVRALNSAEIYQQWLASRE